MTNESTPLLGHIHLPGSKPARIHWLDNLRAVLTILLIFHHAALEVVQASIDRGYFGLIPKSESVFLSIFFAVNKSFLWALYFFVAGYSTRLAIEEKGYDYKVFASRLRKIGLPALLWIWFGRNLFIKFLINIGLDKTLDLHNDYKARTRMVGPVGFVFGLLFLDAIFLISRWIGRHYAWLDISRLFKNMASNRRGFIITALLSVDVALIFTFLSCLGVRFYIGHFYRTFVYDIREYPNSPATFVIAYIAGISFPFIKQYLLIDLRKSIIILVKSELFAYISLGIAQDLTPALGRSIRLRDRFTSIIYFTNPGFNVHTIFYVFWTTFVFYALSISIISVFAQAPATKKNWGLWTKHTYPQTYVHILPIVLILHFVPSRGAWSDVILQTVIAGTVAVLSSWAIVLPPILLTRFVSSRR